MQAIKAPSEPPVMALLYSKDVEMDCEANGESINKKKMQGKKRRLDSSGDKQPKVSLWCVQSTCVENANSLCGFTGNKRQQQ